MILAPMFSTDQPTCTLIAIGPQQPACQMRLRWINADAATVM